MLIRSFLKQRQDALKMPKIAQESKEMALTQNTCIYMILLVYIQRLHNNENKNKAVSVGEYANQNF